MCTYTYLTLFNRFISSNGNESVTKHLPFAGLISKSGLNELKFEITRFSMPLKTDRTIISAAVQTVIPMTEIADITLTILCFFAENRYCHAMKNAVLK